MASNCSIQMISESIELGFEDIEDATLDVFFAFGIVNPFGPTLNFVAAVGEASPGGVLPLVHVMLNPFSQTVEQIGEFTVGDQWNPLTDLEPLMHLNFGNCPTLVLLSRDIAEEVRLPLTSRLLESFGDEVEATYVQVRSSFGDPWKRVSGAMRDTNSPDGNALGVRATAALFAQLALEGEHVWPELQAFSYAWKGSIEESGIPEAMKHEALQAERFSDFLVRRLLPCCWLPDRPDSKEPANTKPAGVPLKPNSPDEVRKLIAANDWSDFTSDDLLQLAKLSMFLYGAEGNEADVQPLSRFYCHVVKHTDPEHRLLMATQLTRMVETANATPAAFFPILVLDPDKSVVGTATIDMVSCSDVEDSGEVTVMKQIELLFKNSSLTNPGAVFGALLWMGEARFTGPLARIRAVLTSEQIGIAVSTHSAFFTHGAIRFWVDWALELVKSTDPKSLGLVGHCAAALAVSRKQNKLGKVFDGERDFPCAGKENPFVNTRVWEIAEYTALLAPELYRLESLEGPPKVMSAVLRIWGLTPAAPLAEQAVPGAG